MMPRIKSVKPLKGYLLHVIFDDGKECIYNVKDDIDIIKSYKDLETITGLFEQVQLDESCTCVFWNDYIDLPSDTIYENVLPETDARKLVIAWNPDFTKVTPAERAKLEEAKREIENGETISHDAINWD